MPTRSLFRAARVLLLAGLLCQFASPASAEETPAQVAQLLDIHLKQTTALLERAGAHANETVERALELVGIRYRRGGTSPETGFDCSGFVGHVFREGLGLILPRTAREISRNGEIVRASELQPGDLVFFNTMRHAFSHVGIYLGDHRFIHAPASGGEVRVEDMRSGYWGRRFNGARRLAAD